MYTSIKKLLAYKPLRYLFAGGTGLVVNLVTLFVLVSVCKIWYLIGTIVAFVVSSLVSFLMQKLLTFSNRSVKRAHVQLGVFFCVALFNLGVNTVLMYGAVGILHTQYLVAQFFVNALIAVYSFFLYKHIVFRPAAI
jgi:putative flippase GtrA